MSFSRDTVEDVERSSRVKWHMRAPSGCGGCDMAFSRNAKPGANQVNSQQTTTYVLTDHLCDHTCCGERTRVRNEQSQTRTTSGIPKWRLCSPATVNHDHARQVNQKSSPDVPLCKILGQVTARVLLLAFPRMQRVIHTNECIKVGGGALLAGSSFRLTR